MRLAMMIIGTLLAVFLIIKYIKGKKTAAIPFFAECTAAL